VPRRRLDLHRNDLSWKEYLIMKRLLVWGVPLLSLALLLTLPDGLRAGSTRSAGSRSTASSARVIYAPVPVAAVARPAAEDDDYAYGSVEESTGHTARIQLRVPANAQVWFDGDKTSQTGNLRPFITPDLKPGVDYAYEIRVRWMEEGQTREQKRKVTFRSGDRLTLNLTQAG
jgi:uncharacterized protein (TIGR03000 family)